MMETIEHIFLHEILLPEFSLFNRIAKDAFVVFVLVCKRFLFREFGYSVRSEDSVFVLHVNPVLVMESFEHRFLS